MAGSVNKVLLIGNVGQDPDIRELQNGGRVAAFSLATSESWKDKAGERREVTQWHRIVVWKEGLVGVVERFVKKGSKLWVEGMLESRKWTSADGQDHYVTEVVIKNFRGSITLLDSANKDNNQYASNGEARRSEYGSNSLKDHAPQIDPQAPDGPGYDDLDEDLPF